MSASATPWSTDVDLNSDRVVVTLLLSLDPGPARVFRPFLDIELDEAEATELVAKLAVALSTLRDARKAVTA